MSDAPVQVPGAAGQPVGNAADDALAPPDDMGAALLAEFERREKATAAPLGKDLGEGPPGGFPPIDEVTPTTRVNVAEATGQAPPSPAQQTAEPAPGSPAASGDGAAEGVPAASSPPDGVAPPVPAGDDAAGLPEGEGQGPAAETPPSGYTYRYHDGQQEQAIQIDDSTVQRALSIDAWARNLPPEITTAIGAIETGQAVAIPRSDYDQFVAWQNQQSAKQRDSDLDQLDLDPQVAEILRKQRDELDALKAQTAAQAQQPAVTPQYQQQVNAGIERDMQVMNTAMQSYAQGHGLTEDEVQGLLGTAVNAQLIPKLVEINTLVNPANGQVLRNADMAAVTQQALDWALGQDPHLKTRILAAAQVPGAVQQGAQLPPGAPGAPPVDPVQARKARAGSLASAPSGAAPPVPPRAVAQMSPQDITNAMAADIAAAMAAN